MHLKPSWYISRMRLPFVGLVALLACSACGLDFDSFAFAPGTGGGGATGGTTSQGGDGGNPTAGGNGGTGGTGGTAADIRIQADEILALKRTLNEIIAQHTGKTVEEVDKDTDRDKFLTSREAVEYGIVDEIITPSDNPPKKS